MSWYEMGELPVKVRDSITVQGPGLPGGWACGCLDGKEQDGTPLVWFCHYHEGYYDGIREGQA